MCDQALVKNSPAVCSPIIQWHLNYPIFDYPNTQLSKQFASVLTYLQHTLISNFNHLNSRLSEHFCMVPTSSDNRGCTIPVHMTGSVRPVNGIVVTILRRLILMMVLKTQRQRSVCIQSASHCPGRSKRN